MASRGALIVFEGIDKCGKTTQIEKLAKCLKNIKIQKFPDRTTRIGKLINYYLFHGNIENQALSLLFSANRWELFSEMNQLLLDGYTILCDRYVYSGIVFNEARECRGLKWHVKNEKGLIKPDLVIYLDLLPEVAKTRPFYGMDKNENINFQETVYEYFKLFPSIHVNIWRCIDANRSIDEIHEKIVKIIHPLIETVKNQPIKYL